MTDHNLWIDVDTKRLADNVGSFRRRVGKRVTLAPVVKSNAYGHGMELAAQAFERGGADWLSVHSFREAERLRAAGTRLPILIMGPLHPTEVDGAVQREYHSVVHDLERTDAMLRAATANGRPAHLHLKLETGTQRQGYPSDGLPDFFACLERHGVTSVAGVCSHFANIEDTTRHDFAQKQIGVFESALSAFADRKIQIERRHLASSAATILFPKTHYDLVRPGISAYGYWPSRETLVSAQAAQLGDLKLEPALRWSALVSQVKRVPAGSYIGYGCTYKVETDSRIAVIPVGYADGYRRALSDSAWVLIRGRRCPVRGRICMNLTMVDVSHLPEVRVGEVATLLGPESSEAPVAEQLAEWAGTIHYEFLAGLSSDIPRQAM